MNDNLKNYEVQPDAEVWTNINRELRRRAARRQAVTACAATLLLASAIVAVVAWPSTKEEAVQPSSQPVAAMNVGEVTLGRQPDIAQDQPAVDARLAMGGSPREAVTSTAATTLSENCEPQQSSPAMAVEPLTVKRETAEAVAQPIRNTEAEGLVPAVAHLATDASEPVVAENVPVAARSTSSKAVQPTVQDTILWIPNAFMPGSDQVEITRFRPRLNQPDASVSNYRMVIFNRGGHVVFTTRDMAQGWDGTYKGEEMPQGAYIYAITYTDKDGVQHQRRGTATLIR